MSVQTFLFHYFLMVFTVVLNHNEGTRMLSTCVAGPVSDYPRASYTSGNTEVQLAKHLMTDVLILE